jgi:hypothetical protein
MSVVAEFVKPTDEMIDYIAANMRKADADEVWASHHLTPIESLTFGRKLSKMSAVVMVDDTPCVMLGLVVNSVATGTGTPWLLGTDDALRHKRHFIDLVPPVIDEMLDECPILCNYVHADNKVSIRWLKRIGFTLDPATPHGISGELFHRFHLKRV